MEGLDVEMNTFAQMLVVTAGQKGYGTYDGTSILQISLPFNIAITTDLHTKNVAI